ncbi:hypothetical protein [Paraburkholderia adhaesiva]|uniref:hypothetical protein n=1 Tax=Paraburkholderia adhaesiva TaxID=2883244 RepID=UPI001F2E2890|nr:hypothetical protein [Paraburkholderia adhaesiva]
MDVQQLVSEFLASEHGSQATQALSAQGIGADDAQKILSQAAATAHAQGEGSGGLLGEHAGGNFFSAFAAGLTRGDGLLKSLMDGGQGVLTGRVAESLAERMGIDPSIASTLSAAATPYLAAFLKERFA